MSSSTSLNALLTPAALTESAAPKLRLTPVAINAMTIHPLANEHRTEVIAFLAARPLHNVYLIGLISDNGLVSSLNRGTFYACRNREGRLEGVALIGHATLFETHTEAAIQAIARFAQNCPHAHLILGEQEKVGRFWEYYSASQGGPRRVCRELLFEQRRPLAIYELVQGLRLATLDDLPLVMPAHAEMALEESGINPLEVDPAGFRQRCARRIEQRRVWVWVEQGQLIFKVDIVADSCEVIYLEGVYIRPPERGQSFGLRCMSQLSCKLLEHASSICLLVNEQNRAAQAFYYKAGYRLRGYYDTIFLRQREKADANTL